MQRLGLNPILTLCHHGSGPHYTSLISDSFASGLADHAAAVASRYPWVTDWTPVNEPLTTARFSVLYGYWYPHTTDEQLFWLALLNEIGGIVVETKALDFEIVAKPEVIQVYVNDHGKPVKLEGAKGKVTLLNGGEKTEVELVPAGDKLEAKGSFKVAKGTKGIATVALAGKSAAIARFEVK